MNLMITGFIVVLLLLVAWLFVRHMKSNKMKLNSTIDNTIVELDNAEIKSEVKSE